MRIAIREQLAALVILTVLLGITVVSIPTWIYVHNFVVNVESDGLTLTASLKASRVSSEIDLLLTICQNIATRILLQEAFENFYQNPNGSISMTFDKARQDLISAMSRGSSTVLLQAQLYSRNTTGPPTGLLGVTGNSTNTTHTNDTYKTPDGATVDLGQYQPPPLYPNITYIDLGHPNKFENTTQAYNATVFPNVTLQDNGGLVLGPLFVNESFALISLTIPIKWNRNKNFTLGYMTLVADAQSLIDVQASREGLGDTGMTLIIGPNSPTNRFNTTSNQTTISPNNKTAAPVSPASSAAGEGRTTPKATARLASLVHFVLAPITPNNTADRHQDRSFATLDYSNTFSVSMYPALERAYINPSDEPNQATSILSTTNEQGIRVAVGVAKTQSALVDWAIIVEKAEDEAYEPIYMLRNILLACAFGSSGVIMLLVVPCAHLGVKPIRRLKAATAKSISPPGQEDGSEEYEDSHQEQGSTIQGLSEKTGFFSTLMGKIRNRKKNKSESEADSYRRGFKIPGRVEVSRRYITDELTELTDTFNEMGDELLKSYTSLDEKVADRTRQLEISKRAAEAANESKTLFIANISHELKTPLNGIMGMCAILMEEDDVMRIKHSLKTVYRSGDLLLHLLEDLLNFSKNQIGQQVNLEEKEFRLGDFKSQMLSIFDKQVRENKVNFSVSFMGPESELSGEMKEIIHQWKLPALGPSGTGRIKDMYLWGDQHRILQVLINLVSNSLKFTPVGGKIMLRIRCLGEVDQSNDGSRTSSLSRTGSTRMGRTRHRNSSTIQSTNSIGTNTSDTKVNSGTALAINPMDPKATPYVRIRERSPTPPPPNAKPYMFEFEVEDTGPGIPAHMQEKIFEPFVQGDLGLSKKHAGTGLGLSICAQLANLMGGSIAIESEEGKGSMFTMQIPLKYVKDRAPSTASEGANSRRSSLGSLANLSKAISAPSSSEPHPSPSSESLHDKVPRLIGLSAPFFAANRKEPLARSSSHCSLRVLVADDNSTNIEVVSRMLKLEDISDVTVARDGKEAYDLVKENMEQNQPFDVIFMDVQMPNLDGLESTRLIRDIGYSAPIVALTAFSDESNIKECLESGMNEFLSKPIRRPALKQVLEKFGTIPEEEAENGVTMKETTTNGHTVTEKATKPAADGLLQSESSATLTEKTAKAKA